MTDEQMIDELERANALGEEPVGVELVTFRPDLEKMKAAWGGGEDWRERMDAHFSTKKGVK